MFNFDSTTHEDENSGDTIDNLVCSEHGISRSVWDPFGADTGAVRIIGSVSVDGANERRIDP